MLTLKQIASWKDEDLERAQDLLTVEARSRRALRDVQITYHDGEVEVVEGVSQADWDSIPLSSEHGWVRVDDYEKKFVAECGLYWD